MPSKHLLAFSTLLALGACAVPDYDSVAQDMRIPGDPPPDPDPDPNPNPDPPDAPPPAPPPLTVVTQDACVTPRPILPCTSAPCSTGTGPLYHVAGQCNPAGSAISLVDDHSGQSLATTTCAADHTFAFAVNLDTAVHGWTGTGWRKQLTVSSGGASTKLRPALCAFATPTVDNLGSQYWHPPGQCQATASGFVYVFSGRCTVGSTMIVRDADVGQISTQTFGRDQCTVAMVQDATGGIYPASTEGTYSISIPYSSTPLATFGATFGGGVFARDVVEPRTALDSAPTPRFSVSCPQ